MNCLGRESAGEVASTAMVESADTAELVLCVWDPSDTGLTTASDFHAVTFGTRPEGIWQSVWYEAVSAALI